jgi:hypothetical protein
MSTPDQPDTPPLTRRRLREIRNTGSTPVVAPTPEPTEEPVAPTPAPLPRAADPAPVAPAPEAPVDLGVSPLTRRQARAQERIRTASVPVISPDVAPVDAAPAVIASVPTAKPAEVAPSDDTVEQPVVVAEPAGDSAADAPVDDAAPAEVVEAEEIEAEPVADIPASEAGDGRAVEADDQAEPSTSVEEAPATTDARETNAADESEAESADESDQAELSPVLVNPALGSELLAGESPIATLPPSFDQLIARSASATGSIATPNALILSQTPAGAPLVAPVTATGEVLITGTFELPDGLGSVGHLPGTADGKDIDVSLIDGELPPASSPTPIAASAAISTVRNAGEEIIRPPVPEKGSRLMLTLVITAGVLALALAGVLILAITTGRI